MFPNNIDRTTSLLSLARFASAVARLCLGPMLPMLTMSLTFDEASKPGLLSAYSSGYILTQIGGGYLADKYGFPVVVSSTLGISSCLVFYLATIATTAQQWTSAFFIMGIVAGPLFPAGSAAISLTVPMEQRAASAAIVDAAASAGTCLAALTPLIVSKLLNGSWRWLFLWTSTGLALVAVTVFLSFPPNKTTRMPSSSSYNSMTTKQQLPTSTHHYTTTNFNNHDDKPNNNLTPALLQPTALLTYLCHSVDNFSKYGINAYAATLLVSKHHASQALVGTILGTQEAVGVISKVLVGTISSGTTTATLRTRGIASAVGFFIQGLALHAAFNEESSSSSSPSNNNNNNNNSNTNDDYYYYAYMTGAWLVVSAIAAGSHSIGYRPIYVEAVAPEYAGAVSGLGNTIASFASVLGPMTIGTAILAATTTTNSNHEKTLVEVDMHDDGDNWLVVARWMLLVNLCGCLAAGSIALCLGSSTTTKKGGGGDHTATVVRSKMSLVSKKT